jgi:hypothetical protein
MGTRRWLEEGLKDIYLPRLEQLTNSDEGRAEAQQLTQELRQWWADKGFPTAEQQQTLMDATRSAIAQQMGRDHFTMGIVKLTREEYFAINQKKQSSARDRQIRQQFISKPEEIVNRAVRLLKSEEWAEIAAALAILTGRRLNEVLETAEFTVKSQWIVTFEGALKRRDDPLVFDIPTLTTAKRIVDATLRLRQIAPPDANEAKVGQVSDRIFADLVPLPHGKGNLYSHLWRSVYCCIATFWYCPPHTDDLLFKAHIMGHFESLSPEERADDQSLRQRLEVFSSDRHYRLYEISDDVIAHHKGKRKGIKLGYAGIKPLEAFVEGMPEHQPAPVERKHRTTIHVWQNDRARIVALLENFDGITQPEKVAAWVEWTEQQLANIAAPTEQVEEAISPTPITAAEPVTEPAETTQEVAAPTQPSSLENKIESLISVMQQFVELQIASPTAKPERQKRLPRTPVPTAEGNGAAPEAPTSKGRRRGGDDEIVSRAIDAIMVYNDESGRLHDEKWFVTANLLKKFTERGNQRAAERVLQDRAEEIQSHHQKHKLQADHNNRHKRHNILEIVKIQPPENE